MKTIYLSIILAFATTFAVCAQTASPEAMKAYKTKRFEKAAELLQKEADTHKAKGEVSADLLYNLGNAYFRANELGKAILYYERALLLSPGNSDIRHNIAYAQTKIEDADQIAKTEDIFLKEWFESIEDICSSNTWAKLGIVFFFLAIAGCFFFLFGKKILVKKIGFYSSISCIVLVILFNLFAYYQKQDNTLKNTAIVMSPSVDMVSSPGESSKVLTNIHAGLKVRITKTDGDWYEIKLDNGNVGWVHADELEII